MIPVLQLRPLVAVVVATLALAVLAEAGGCSGCSAECAGDNAGSAGCGCSSDQDCTTRKGTVLLCVDGSCTKGDPEDVPGDPCGADDDCGAGRACGIDELCLAAPACQRIDGDLAFLTADGNGGTLTATRNDCDHAWAGGGVDVDVAIDLSGAMTLTDNGGLGCNTGRWFAGDRVGEIECEAGVLAVTPAGLDACIGADACNACSGRIVDATTGVGVCR